MRPQLGLGACSALAAILCTACGGGGGGGGSSSSSLSYPYSQYLQVSSTTPNADDVDVALDAGLSVTFDRAVDPASVSGNFLLLQDGNSVAGSASVSADARKVSFVPDAALSAGTIYQIQVTPEVKSAAGIPLYIESRTAFQTIPAFSARLFPYTGAILYPLNAGFAALFPRPVDPATVSSSTFYVQKSGVDVAGSLSLELGNRVVKFQPTANLTASSVYTITVVGGAGGILSESGDELAADSTATISTSSGNDVTAPTVKATVHEVPSSMNSGLHVPLAVTRLDISFSDGLFNFVNPGSCQLTSDAAIGGVAAGENLLTGLSWDVADYSKIRVHLPPAVQIPAGSFVLTAECSDLAGNAATSNSLTVTAHVANNTLLPFENFQVCWARFDMNRDDTPGNDFTRDLIEYGLISAADPLGKNAQLEAEIIAGIVDWANVLFLTNSWGRVLVTSSQPNSALYMKIAVGGFDPGSSSEDLDGQTTGVLGRAYFDDLNANYSEDDTATSPALGVFPLEMYRAYTTAYSDSTFSATFSPLSPNLGGTPLGDHAQDAAILAPGFDYATATSAQQSRYNTVQTALTRFKKVIGFLLAHETAHSCGLVPDALNGYAYHDKNGSITDVMLPSVSFSNIALTNVKFRPLDLNYLVQWILKV